MEKSKVFFTKEITSDSLIKIFKALNINLKGKVAVKISSGEMGGHNYLDPNLIKGLVNSLNGTLVECNTAYEGKRSNSKDHWETIKNHGFLDIAPFDIMDEEGEIELPIKGGKRINKDYVGSHIQKYDSMLVLSHFKGHMMGGFGGALKNISIGVASSHGKAFIHGAGDISKIWSADHDSFLESMADADNAVINHFGKENMAYINVANKLSVDCDCDSNPHKPKMADIGIFASLDPVALDKACYDAVKNSNDKGKFDLIERMDSRHAIHIVEQANAENLGNTEYEIINIDI
jgi:uncharacterized protein